ncbi:MAG: HAD family hydrolase [Bacilli bacterium]|jgi:hypothetical protein
MIFKKIPRHVIAMDLDGTLLTDDKTIDPRTKRYLRHLEKQGHIIVLASGRPYRAVINYYKEIGLKSPVICYNGAYVVNPSDERFPIANFDFPATIIKDIYANIDPKYITNIMVETNEKIWFLRRGDDFPGFLWKDNMDIAYGDLRETLNENPMTMIIKVRNRDAETEQALIQAASRHPGVKVRFWALMLFSEIYFDHISKGHALHDIAKYFGVPLERTLAFGDADNDIEMLSMAGVGFAMQNADHAIKAKADFITKYTNNEQGLLHGLKSYFRKARF